MKRTKRKPSSTDALKELLHHLRHHTRNLATVGGLLCASGDLFDTLTADRMLISHTGTMIVTEACQPQELLRKMELACLKGVG